MIAAAAIMALFGAIVGSFVGAAVLRLPIGRGIIVGRSSCDGCGKILGPAELIPILSYVCQRGCCRRCGDSIVIVQPLAEISCAIVGILVALSADSLAWMLALALFGWMLVTIALLDARHHWLPDMLTLPLGVLGIGVAYFLAPSNLNGHLLGACIAYLVLEGLRRAYRALRGRDGLGGGDPKLFAAIGAWFGGEALPWIMLGAGAMGLLCIGFRRALGHQISRDDRVPLGTLLAIASIVLIPIIAPLS